MLLRLTSDNDENGEYVTSFFCKIINERERFASELRKVHNDSVAGSVGLDVLCAYLNIPSMGS